MWRNALFLFAVIAGIGSARAEGNPDECFPMCESQRAAVARGEPAFPVSDAGSIRPESPVSCEGAPALIKDVDAINDRVKPIRDWAGYIRAPQGLVLKLVNDHLFKLPGWLGFAMDPVGTLKHRAIDEVRTRARDLVTDHDACEADVLGARSIDAV